MNGLSNILILSISREFEKESELELDWYFEYFVNTIKIDYGISQILNYQKKCKLY